MTFEGKCRLKSRPKILKVSLSKHEVSWKISGHLHEVVCPLGLNKTYWYIELHMTTWRTPWEWHQVTIVRGKEVSVEWNCFYKEIHLPKENKCPLFRCVRCQLLRGVRCNEMPFHKGSIPLFTPVANTQLAAGKVHQTRDPCFCVLRQ